MLSPATLPHMPHLRRLISASNLIALLALVLACGGSAWAGATMVSGAQIRDGSVSGIDLRNGGVRRADLDVGARVPNVVVRDAHELGAGPVTVLCQGGERALGGGGSAPNMWQSQPTVNDAFQPVGWTVSGRLDQGGGPQGEGDGPVAVIDPVTVAYVICARA